MERKLLFFGIWIVTLIYYEIWIYLALYLIEIDVYFKSVLIYDYGLFLVLTVGVVLLFKSIIKLVIERIKYLLFNFSSTKLCIFLALFGQYILIILFIRI